MKSYILLAFVLGSLSAVSVDARRRSKTKTTGVVQVSQDCMKQCSDEKEDIVCSPNGDAYKNRCEFNCENEGSGMHSVKGGRCRGSGSKNKSDRDSDDSDDSKHHSPEHGGLFSGLLGGTRHHGHKQKTPCYCNSGERRRVCGSDGTFYANECYMRCKSTRSNVMVADDSKCEKEDRRRSRS